MLIVEWSGWNCEKCFWLCFIRMDNAHHVQKQINHRWCCVIVENPWKLMILVKASMNIDRKCIIMKFSIGVHRWFHRNHQFSWIFMNNATSSMTYPSLDTMGDGEERFVFMFDLNWFWKEMIDIRFAEKICSSRKMSSIESFAFSSVFDKKNLLFDIFFSNIVKTKVHFGNVFFSTAQKFKFHLSDHQWNEEIIFGFLGSDRLNIRYLIIS